ncbi:MAG: minor capsid protein, partial [Oscillospiraceae bacterium]|nr:minor capsid protein [Oscillospiraceae bacterium]
MANQSNYWDQRTLSLQNSIALHEQALFQNLRKYYNTEAAELDRDIAAYYSKYGTNNVIQYRNLLQSLSDADKQLLYEKIQDFEKQYPQYAHLTPIRESIYKLDRLEGLRTSVAIQQLKMGAYEIAQAQAHFQQMALLSGNLIAEQMGYGSSFYRIDSDMLRLVVGQDWCNNQDFSARIWNNRNALTQTLQTQLVNGMIRGNSYKDISKSVLNKFQTVSQRNIERLVFTEDTFLANEAAMQTYLNDPDYAYYEYVALCDGKTCDLCASLTEERFRISERRPGTNFPPMHPWCRCFFDIFYEKNSERFSERNPEKNRLTFSDNHAIMDQEKSFRIPITDETIKNVQLIQPDGFSIEDAITLQEAHRRLLEEARKHPLGTECCILLDMMDMEQIGEITIGEIDSVHPPKCYEFHAVLHNHSSGATFSVGDIARFANFDTMQMMTAMGHNSKVYCLLKKVTFDHEKCLDYLGKKLTEKVFKGKIFEELTKEFVSTLTENERE